MCKKSKKADIIAGNAKKKVQQLKKIGSRRSVKGKERVSEKEIREEKVRRYWRELRAKQLLDQLAGDANKN